MSKIKYKYTRTGKRTTVGFQRERMPEADYFGLINRTDEGRFEVVRAGRVLSDFGTEEEARTEFKRLIQESLK